MRNICKKRNGKAMPWLINDLKVYANKGNYLHMGDVYNYYETICIETNEPILLSYSSRKYIFKDKVLVLIGSVYDFHDLGVHD